MTPRALRTLAQWIAIGALVGALAGGASAVFLLALERVTALREEHRGLVYALPAAGVIIGVIYSWLGKSIKGGTSTVLDTLHAGGAQIPLRMAPMVLVGTVVTHLFGGSAGREGTAVQMGSTLADAVAHALGLDRHARRQAIAAGMAGGFGSVFGTPIAGMIFGLEAVRVGRIEYDAILPALVASLVGDLVTRALGVHHSAYPIVGALDLTPLVLSKWIVLGAAAGAVALAFVELLHRLKKLLEGLVPVLALRMLVGGVAVVAMWRLVGTNDYLGLGVPTILRAFSDPNLPAETFAWKLAFTVVTLAAGFLGGEVTPLFFVGAALGNALGRLLGLPIDLAAACGLAAVFGAAANTPIALAVMTVELVGAGALPHVLVVTVVAYLVSGHRGIYVGQRVAHAKLAARSLPAEVALRDWTGDDEAHAATGAPSERKPDGQN